MFKDFDVNIIDKYLKEKFPIIFDFEFNGMMLLKGGTIRDLIMGKKESKDLDFALLSQKKSNFNDFVEKYNIEVIKKSDRGYKLKYNEITIDIHITNDLYDDGHLSTNFLFYDINRKELIPIGIKRSIEKNIIYDYYFQGYNRTKKRIKKAKEFLMYFNNGKTPKVKYQYNRIYYVSLAAIRRVFKLLKKKYKQI